MRFERQLGCGQCANPNVTTLYRIAQEALANAAKHARASEIRVELRCPVAGGVQLAVRDDGIGREAAQRGKDETAGPGEGLGLGIMAHRAAIIQAELRIEDAPAAAQSSPAWRPAPWPGMPRPQRRKPAMTPDPTAAHVLLIDDHPAVRQGLRLLLESRGHRPGAEAATRAEALAALETARFDLALLDLSLEDGSGLDLLADIDERAVPVLVYSMHEEVATIHRALRCGANGYVTKREEPEVLLEGVEALMRGEGFVSPRAGQALAEKSGMTGTDPLALLSDRERSIFSAMARGAANAEIAARLGISPRTVETYLARMVKKLEMENIRALRKFIIAGGR